MGKVINFIFFWGGVLCLFASIWVKDISHQLYLTGGLALLIGLLIAIGRSIIEVSEKRRKENESR